MPDYKLVLPASWHHLSREIDKHVLTEAEDIVCMFSRLKMDTVALILSFRLIRQLHAHLDNKNDPVVPFLPTMAKLWLLR